MDRNPPFSRRRPSVRSNVAQCLALLWKKRAAAQLSSFRLLRALGEMRPHPARRESSAAAPAAQHSWPGGRPRLGFAFLPRSPCPEATGRFAHMVKCARMLRPVSWAPQPQRHFIRGRRGRPMRLNAGSSPNCLTRTQLRHLRHFSDTQRLQKGGTGW